jgi:hypothetical protein
MFGMPMWKCLEQFAEAIILTAKQNTETKSMNLTQNFTLSEMTKSDGFALWYGNDPTETEIENMRLLCEKVLQARA